MTDGQVTVLAQTNQLQSYEVKEMTVEEAVARFAKIEQLATRVLKEGAKEGTGDYGVFPGTKQKVLFKSGAEKLCTVFRLGANYSIEKFQTFPDDDHVVYTVRCTLRNQANGIEVGSALGLCSSKETKYRYRSGSRKCPKCGAEAIIKGKAEYGGGWLCFAKRNGCGEKFKDGDHSIEGQDTGKIENPDIADVENTVLKMAEKRAHVAATLNALGISSLFTQDIVQDNSDEGEPESKPGKPQNRAKSANPSPEPPAQGVDSPTLVPGVESQEYGELKAYLDAAGEVGGPELGAAWVNKTFQAKVKKLSAEEQDKLTVHKDEWKSHWETKGEA